MAKFSISTDSSLDAYKSYLAKNRVHCLIMKRIINGTEVSEHYDSRAEFDDFFETLKKGAMPTTVALNPTETQEHFEKIMQTEKEGDIIHLSLSSGLSLTYDSAVKAANELNSTAKDGRKVYAIDSLVATSGIDLLVDELIKMRDAGVATQEAIARIDYLRTHMQGWVIMSDLFHLKRGGRISGIKATIGTILGIKPIVCINHKGKLVIENKMKGTANAISYLLKKIEELGEKAGKEFFANPVYVIRTSESKLYDDLKIAVSQKYPEIEVRESVVGPIIGTHLGCGGAIVLFIGAPRLTVN